MQNAGRYILVLVIGAIIGLAMGAYVSMNQTPSMGEQVKVTIQGIEYTTSDHSVLEIEVLNIVPEKNLKDMSRSIRMKSSRQGRLCGIIQAMEKQKLSVIQ